MAILNGPERISIGDLDREITLKSLSYTTGDSGQQVPNVETSETLWAKINYRFGDEEAEAGRQEMNSRIEFMIRYYDGITNKYWIEFESEVYDIIHIEVIGRRGYHLLLTEKRV